MEEESITLTITFHRDGFYKDEFEVESYNDQWPTLVDKEHLMRCIKRKIEEELDVEIDD